MDEGGSRLWPAALAAVAGSIMVGFMPLLARRLYAEGMSAPSMLFWRYALALLALAAALAIARLDLLQAWRAGAWRIGVVGASLGAAQTLCFWESLKTLDTSIAVLLFYTYPVVALTLDRVIFKAPLRAAPALCVAAILAGAALITGAGLRGGTIDLRGLAWAIPSPLVYAFYLALNARLLRRHPPLIGAVALYLGMGLSFALAMPFIGLDLPASATTWGMLLFIALGPGALTITLFSFSVPRLGPASYAIIANTELVTVVAIGTLLLGEPVTPGRAIGGALILGGILAHGLTRKPAPRPDPLPAREEREGAAPAGAGG